MFPVLDFCWSIFASAKAVVNFGVDPTNKFTPGANAQQEAFYVDLFRGVRKISRCPSEKCSGCLKVQRACTKDVRRLCMKKKATGV